MTAFATAVDMLFADPNLGANALHTPSTDDALTSVRIIARRPDEIVGFGDTRVVSATMMFEVRTSQIVAPATGESL